MTINQLALTLIAEQDEASDNAEFITVVEGWIDDALNEFSSYHDWRFLRATRLFSTQVNVNIYEIDANVRDIRAFRFVDTNESIEYVDGQRLIDLTEDFERTGKPQFWFWYENLGTLAAPKYQIQFVPKPDAIYSIQYLAVLQPALTPLTSSQIPAHPEMLIAIKNRVRAYILASDKDFDGHDRYLQMFLTKMDDMKQKENANPANNLRMQVRDISNQGDRRLARLDPNHFS